jgi:hypothetical protein
MTNPVQRAPSSRPLKDYKSFLLFLTYVNPTPHALDSRHEPALALSRRAGGVGRSYIIPLPAAAKYMNSDGSPTEDFVASAFRIAVTLGLEPTRSELRRIVDAVADFMPELVAAPPWEVIESRLRAAPEEPNADVTIRDGMGRKIHGGRVLVP